MSDIEAAGPAEIVLACADLPPTLAWFQDRLGFRVEAIFPAESPREASITGLGLRLRLSPDGASPGELRIPTLIDPPPAAAFAPNGTRIIWAPADPPIDLAPLIPAFVFSKASDAAHPEPGRAGMLYRDLIPGRQGGRFIGSHISIPGGGLLSDWVHFHKIRFQMIFCRRGWVRVAYEDQGEPIVMQAGDMVVQPPRIRHRVLEASEGLEVVEIGCPALHETLADHAMTLPTGRVSPDRDFGGQTFLFHVAAKTPWEPEAGTGLLRRETGVARATNGVADVQVLKPGSAAGADFGPHAHEMLFGFVLEGSGRLTRAGETRDIEPADAFVIPPGEPWTLSDAGDDLQLLRVTVG